LYNELVVPVLQPTVGSAVNNASKVVSVGTKAIALGNTVLQSAPGFAADLGQQVGQQAIQEAERVGTSVDAVQAAAATAAAQRQTGGGHTSSHTSGPGPILAGALTALLLAGGLKGFYDFLSKQVA
jgi:type IV secretory pathway VirB6-like protein